MNRTLLQGALVYDGSGADGVRADVLVERETIAAVAPGLAVGPAAAEVVDCRACALAPGFIDLHGHSDFMVLGTPNADSRVLAGVTTELGGNCGSSPFPLGGELTRRKQHMLSASGVAIDWLDAQGYFERFARGGSSMNLALLAGHGNLRALTVGYAAGAAAPAQLDRMAELLGEALQAGAFGMSTGLVYPPGCYASTDEVAALARVAGRLGGLYASHIRNEGPRLLEAVREFLEIIERGQCRGVISHIKTAQPANWRLVEPVIELIEAARRRGLQVYADRYPYLASETDLGYYVLPHWVHADGTQAELARLGDPATLKRLRDEIKAVRTEPDWPDRLRICGCASDKNAWVAGLSVRQLAERWSMEPFDAAVRLLVEEELRVDAVNFAMCEENLRRFLGLPYVCAASDSSVKPVPLTSRAKPHPRGFGTPARFLARYVRDAGLMTWGEGLRRLTGLPAEILGWRKRGLIAPGAVADITVFSPDELADRATYEEPAVPPTGIRHVLVAGQFVVRDGRHTGARPGRIIKRGDDN